MKTNSIGVKELSQSLDCEFQILGDKECVFTAPAPLDKSDDDSIAFCSKRMENEVFEGIRNTRAGVVVCSNNLEYPEQLYKEKTLILVPNPRLVFFQILQRYFEENLPCEISQMAVIHEEADIGTGVYIGPHTHLGKCRIGKGTIIHSNVYIHSNVEIGEGVIIHPGAVVGSDGFGYERNEKSEQVKCPHVGGVVIEDDVEIGSNTCIDRGTISNTIIGRGTKIDNLCHIAHNVIIGEHCTIIAQSLIGGGVTVGDYAWIAPCACIRDGIKIGKKSIIGMGSVITKDVGDGWVVYGVPGVKVRENKTTLNSNRRN